MTKILVQPPQLRKTAEELLAHAQKIDQALKEIDADIRSLRGHRFIGHRADAVQAHYAPKRDALLNAKQMVINFAEELTTAASVFEKADNGEGNTSSFSETDASKGELKRAPKDARNLAGKVDEYYGETMPDVQIVRTGDGEYLVILPGTKGGNNWNNWGGAMTSGMGVETPFERQIQELIANNIPPGSTINFVGHSQGGILARNLVEHEIDGALSEYTVGSVITYGSPESAYKVEGVEYRNYELLGDPVPLMDQNMINPLGIPVALGVGIGSVGANLYQGMEAFEPHGIYDQVISQDGLPFEVTEWTVVGSDYADVATSGLAGLETSLRSGDPLRIAEDLAIEVPRGAAMITISAASNTIEYFCPDDIALQVDRFSESTLQYISEFDEVQFAQNIHDGAVYVGNEVVEVIGETAGVVGDFAQSTSDVIVDGVAGAADSVEFFFAGMF